MLDKLIILKETGEEINVELVSVFLIPDIKKQFTITTTNEIDPNGLVKLHVSEIKNNKLYKVENDEDWAVIKTVMRSIISSSAGNYQYLSALTKVESVTDYTRGIAVQIVAKEQLANDYKKNKPTDMAIKPVAEAEKVEGLGTPAHVMTETAIDAPQGNVVAPGIVETPSTGNTFEAVKAPEAPTDLIIADQEAPKVEELAVEEQPIIPETKTVTADAPIINIEPASDKLEVDKPSVSVLADQAIITATPIVEEKEVALAPKTDDSVSKGELQNSSTPQLPVMDINMFQQMYQQMIAMQQEANPNGTNTMPVAVHQEIKLSDEELNQIINEAKEKFALSIKELIETIINNVNAKLKAKSQEINKK